MSAVLRLESFSARIIAPPPATTPEQLAEARAEGFAAGRAAGTDTATAAVAETIRALAAALAGTEAERVARDAEARRSVATLVRTVIARIAPRLRAESLAERIVLELTARDIGAPAACRIRCSAGLVAPLAQALAAAGLTGVEVTAGSGPPEVVVPGGALRIDIAAFEAALDRLVADLGEGNE